MDKNERLKLIASIAKRNQSLDEVATTTRRNTERVTDSEIADEVLSLVERSNGSVNPFLED